ncbi:DUF4870 domain-containing protein [Leptolyngbya sp. KIOST-1]|uniref:DUF4870 domain-containing protein n=1 Tax=Leptolyngbya sp. KIOST-1 TaxID=1229172 RepID=UPI0005610462|nr:DUF4870 domain-containing protein [Leptolyngbya sp. KIOST-1]
MEAERPVSLRHRRLGAWCHFLPLGAIALTRHLVAGSTQANFALDSFWTTGADVALATWLSPYLELVVGLGIWLLLGRGHGFVRYHLEQVLRFQVTSVALSTLAIGLIAGTFYWMDAAYQNADHVGGWIVLGLLIALSPLVLGLRVLCMLVVGIEAYRGVRSYYPVYWPWR